MRTAISQLALASSGKGNRNSPESFSRQMCSSTCAWARMKASSVDRVAVLVGVEAPVAVLEAREQAVLGTGVQRLAADDAAGCPRAGGEVTSAVSSTTARPRAVSPSWVTAGVPDALRCPMAAKMAAVIWAFGRHDDGEADVALPAAPHEVLGAPRRVGADRRRPLRRATGRRRCGGRARSRAGSWAIASSRTTRWSATVLAPALPGRSIPASASPVAVGEAEHRVEAEAALVVGAGAFLVLGVDLDERGVDVEDDRLVAVGGPTGARPRARTSASAGGDARSRVSAVISWKVRYSVESDGTEPEQVPLGPAGARCRRSSRRRRRASRRLDEDLAAVVQRRAFAWNGDAPRRVHHRAPGGRQKHPRACSPTWATTPVSPRFHNDAKRAGSFHLVGALLVRVLVMW